MEIITHEGILKAGLYKSLSIGADEAETAKRLHAFMLRLRLTEEALAREYHPADEMRCPVHFCVGQEAVPAALSLLLRDDDYLYSHHRSHGYYLAKHAPMPALFAELYGKQTGANAGLAGSQDISFPSRHFFSGAILAGATAISLGSALAFQLQGTDQVAVAGFGEAATDEGIFWESVNYAAFARLPLVLVCENNNYSVFSPQLKRQSLDNISERVRTFGVASAAIFGNDAMLVHRTLRDAIARARAGQGPTFVEAQLSDQAARGGAAGEKLASRRGESTTPAGDRDGDRRVLSIREIESFSFGAGLGLDQLFEHDPGSGSPARRDRPGRVRRAPGIGPGERLLRHPQMPTKPVSKPSRAAQAAAREARAAPHPDASYADALKQGLEQAMELSDRVLVVGQLVDYAPGVFGSTTGLAERFGTKRVRDFPVSESAMTALGIGAAIAGMRPVLVHHRLDFMLYSIDAIVNWLSLWRFTYNGKSSAPVTIRAIVGRGWGQGPQHSKSLHAWFAHIPGIKVAMPATAFDAKGLLLESIFGEDPVIMIEHRSLFGLKDRVPQFPYRVRFGQAAVRRAGTDLTLVAAGVMVPFALRVAAGLAEHGVESEVIDLRTISPLDSQSVCDSVRKTGRLAVLDPTWASFGMAAEVIARVAERLGRSLRADPVRIAHTDSHTPMSSALEGAYYPEETSVVERLRSLVSHK